MAERLNQIELEDRDGNRIGFGTTTESFRKSQPPAVIWWEDQTFVFVRVKYGTTAVYRRVTPGSLASFNASMLAAGVE